MVHKVWKSLNSWRGYYTYEPTVDTVPLNSKDEAVVTECNFVPHEQNKEFIKLTKKYMKKYFSDVKTRVGRTSNVFSSNIILTAKPKNSWTKELKEKAKKFDKLFVDYYTKGFSIFSGTTYPIDLKEYEKKLKRV